MKHSYSNCKHWLLLCFLMLAFNQIASAQTDCDIKATGVAKHLTCQQDGQITINLTGTDAATGLGGQLYKVTHRVSGKSSGWVENNVIGQLDAGTYQIEVEVLCLKTGRKQVISNIADVTLNATYTPPTFVLNASNFAQTLSCLPSGRIAYTASGGKSTYKLEIVSKPAAYTGQTVWTGITTGIKYIDDLPAGSYQLRLTDACGYSIEQTAVVTVLASNYPTSGFYYFLPSVTANKCYELSGYKRADSADPTYLFWSNWSKYYEYVWLLPGQSPNVSTVWSAFTSTEFNNVLYSSANTLKQIRDNMATLKPNIWVRVKGGNCTPQMYTISLYGLSLNNNNIEQTCTEFNWSFSTDGSIYGVLCYPYTWKLINTATSATVRTSAPEGISNTAIQTISNIPHGSYKLEFTDSQGTTWSSTRNISSNSTSAITSVPSYGPNYYCYDSGSIYFYSTGNQLMGYNIRFVPYSAANAANTSEPGVTVPVNTNYTVPVTSKSGYTYAYPYSADATSSSNVPMKPGKYVFEITDPCGNKQLRTINFAYPYTYTGTPTYTQTLTCSGVVVTPTNLHTLVTRENATTHIFEKQSANMKVTGFPAGVNLNDVQYFDKNGVAKPSNAQYCTATSTASSGDYFVLPKGGTYTISVSSQTGFGAYYCSKEYQITVSKPQAIIDPETKAAYRCKGTVAGVGYISIKAINGSGKYEYTLYSKTDLTTPLTMTNPAYTNPNITGIFKDWVATNTDKYVVVTKDLTCGEQFSSDIDVLDLNNPAIVSLVGGNKTRCVGETIQLSCEPLGITDYKWTSSSDPSWTSTSRTPIIPNIGMKASGRYTVKVQVPGCTGEIEWFVDVLVAPKTMYWKDNAADNNWNSTNNWLDSDGNEVKSIPAPCTTVHIPGNAVNFPILDLVHTPGDYATCDTIVYHYGAETPYPHYLKYRRAKVQYNLGYYYSMTDPQPYGNADEDLGYWFEEATTAPLNRAQWYSLAAPLKQMVGGDFGIGPKPMIWQRLFNPATSISGVPASLGFTKEFNTQNIELKSTNNAIGIWVSDYQPAYTGMGDHSDLQGLGGVFEMPYHRNSEILKHRPFQSYVPIDANKGTSYFQYYTYFSDGSIEPSVKKDAYARDTMAFRFVFENATGGIDRQTIAGVANTANYRMAFPSTAKGQKLFIGNPFMSSIDFDKLIAINSATLANSYEINDGNENKFFTYQIGSPVNTLSKQVAPLQGFIVEIKSSAINNYIDFPMEGASSVMAVDNVNAKVKTAKVVTKESKGVEPIQDQGYIALYGITPPVIAGRDSIRIATTLMYNYNIGNATKSVFPDDMDTKAEVFFIDEAGYLNTNQEEYAKRQIIPLGLQSTYKGEIVFKFVKGGDAPIDQVFLVDKYLGKSVLLNNTTYYKFSHRYARVESGVQGLDTDRFELNVTYRTVTGVEENMDNKFEITANDNKLTVKANSLIEHVEIRDLQGTLLKSVANIDTNSYVQSLSLTPGVYIVKADLKNNQTKTAKIIIE